MAPKTNRIKFTKSGRVRGSLFKEFKRYFRVSHFGESDRAALNRVAREAREARQARELIEAAETAKQEARLARERERARSPASIADESWNYKYATFLITIKVNHPPESHRFFRKTFRGTNVLISDLHHQGEKEEHFTIRLSCGEGKNSVVKVVERAADEIFSIVPDADAIDEIGVTLHLTIDSLDPVRINLAKQGCETRDIDHARALVFRDLEYVGSNKSFFAAESVC